MVPFSLAFNTDCDSRQSLLTTRLILIIHQILIANFAVGILRCLFRPFSFLFCLKQLLATCLDSRKQGTEVATHYDWVILPVLNTDGYVYSHEKDRFWRKNRSTVKNSRCKGADLNRNWPFYFNGMYPDLKMFTIFFYIE